jgi:nucleoside-diphosphate-sugar epimerase
MSWFSPEEVELYKNPPVEYVMSNLVNPQSVEKTFAVEGGKFDIVINLAAVGPYGQDQEFYEQKLLQLARVCGAEAKKQGVSRWIEVSTAQVYDSSSKASSESDKLKPFTGLATGKLAVERHLTEIGIPTVILRPAVVYGPGDIGGLMPRLLCGYVYRKLAEEMKLLWTGDLAINTVHVNDVVKAIWFGATKANPGDVFNLADTNKTDQAKVSAIVGKIFGIKTGFYGAVASQIAKVSFSTVVESVNEKHMDPWGEITAAAGIGRTPLSPFLEPELLLKNPLAVDGSKITKAGFAYEVPAPTEANLRESLDYWIGQKVLPPL